MKEPEQKPSAQMYHINTSRALRSSKANQNSSKMFHHQAKLENWNPVFEVDDQPNFSTMQNYFDDTNSV